MGKHDTNFNQLPVIAENTFTTTSDSDFNKAMETMFSPEDLELKTDLSAKQISKLTKLYHIAVFYDNELLIGMYNTFIALNVSKKRKGRTEGVNMTQQIMHLKRLENYENIIREGKSK